MKTLLTASWAGMLALVSVSGHAAPPAKASGYVHAVVTGAGGNLCANDSSHTSTVLNHPEINGNPNAIIVATWNEGLSSNAGGLIAVRGALVVYYDDSNLCTNALNRWVLFNAQDWATTSLSPVFGQERINIIIIAP